MSLNKIDDSWKVNLSNYGIACVPYFECGNAIVTNFRPKDDQGKLNDEEININIEELLTIRGKLGSMYDVSENSYRKSTHKPLRYSHIDNLSIQGYDKSLYASYAEQANRR